MINIGKRVGAALLTIALSGLWVAVTVRPAAAEPSVEVSTVTGNRYTPGEPVAFVVTITADRATDGTIIVRVDGSESARQPFELAGGTTKSLVIVTETLFWGPGFVIQINSSDGDLTLRPGLREDRNSETVGVLASLQAADLPATAPTATGGRTARFYPISELVLNADPRALAMFDSIAGSPDDFATLIPAAQNAVAQWVAQGGQVLVDGPAGTAPPFLTASRSSGAGIGFGTVRYTDGEMRRGNANELVPATSGGVNPEFGQAVDPGQSGRTLVADAGITQPGIGVLLLLIGGYIVVVGPVLFLLLRKAQRQPLAWGVIPALAALTVAAVWGAGRSQRSNVDLAHATIVASLDGAVIERSEVLVASANGGFVGLATGSEFTSVASASSQFGELSLVSLEERDGSVGISLNPGEANRIVVERVGLADQAAALEVNATIQDNRTLQGEVVNNSPFSLEDVRVVSGNAVQLIGTLGPGERQPIALDADFAELPFEQDDLFARMPQEFFDPFDNRRRNIDNAENLGAVNAGALASFVQRFPESRFTGQIMALGWTREPPAPILTDRGAEIRRGRTGFVALEPLTSTNGPVVSYGEATVDLLRMWDFELNDRANGVNEFPSELLVTLPPDADPDDQLVVELPPQVAGLDLWNGSTWEPASRTVLPDLDNRVVLLTEDTIRQGQVHLRVGFVGFNQRNLPIVRSISDAEFEVALAQTEAEDDQ